MGLSLALAVAGVVLCAAIVLPACLGVLKRTHRWLADPRGGFLFFRLGPWLYGLSLLLVAGAAVRAVVTAEPLLPVVLAGVAFLGLSLFGFLMHTGLMFKPIRRPLYLSVPEAVERFGEAEEVVGVIDPEGEPYAYVARLARRPHVVFQPEGGSPFIMSHCILSHSSMAYRLDERFRAERLFITSVLANNLVFYDPGNRCTVLQIENRARDGRLRLGTLPTVMTSLATWRRYFPDSKVWYRPREWRDTFYLKLLARASIIDPASPDLLYPLAHEEDRRLPLKSYVLGVERGGEAKAYPLEGLRHEPLIEDELGGDPLLVLASDDGDFAGVYSPTLPAGSRLRFKASPGGGFEDLETGSRWDCTGSCLGGELRGERLPAIPHYNKIFWFVWADFFPHTAVYGEAAVPPPGPSPERAEVAADAIGA